MSTKSQPIQVGTLKQKSNLKDGSALSARNNVETLEPNHTYRDVDGPNTPVSQNTSIFNGRDDAEKLDAAYNLERVLGTSSKTQDGATPIEVVRENTVDPEEVSLDDFVRLLAAEMPEYHEETLLLQSAPSNRLDVVEAFPESNFEQWVDSSLGLDLPSDQAQSLELTDLLQTVKYIKSNGIAPEGVELPKGFDLEAIEKAIETFLGAGRRQIYVEQTLTPENQVYEPEDIRVGEFGLDEQVDQNTATAAPAEVDSSKQGDTKDSTQTGAYEANRSRARRRRRISRSEEQREKDRCKQWISRKSDRAWKRYQQAHNSDVSSALSENGILEREFSECWKSFWKQIASEEQVDLEDQLAVNRLDEESFYKAANHFQVAQSLARGKGIVTSIGVKMI